MIFIPKRFQDSIGDIYTECPMHGKIYLEGSYCPLCHPLMDRLIGIAAAIAAGAIIILYFGSWLIIFNH